MVQVRMTQEDVVDARELVEREVTHAGARIDEDVVVEKKGCGLAARRDRAGAAKNSNLHAVCAASTLALRGRVPLGSFAMVASARAAHKLSMSH
jgi:hypothetical protein